MSEGVAMNVQHSDAGSVDHLLALGYVDPAEVSAREKDSERRYVVEIKHIRGLVAENRCVDALSALVRLIEQEPERVSPRQLLALVLYRAGRWRQTIDAIDWLACHGIESPRLAFMSGHIALMRRDMSSALTQLDYACVAGPELPGAFALLGEVMLRLYRIEEADAAFQRALEANPSDAVALDGLAVVHLRRGDPERAANAALRALDCSHQMYRAHYHLGVALTQLEQPNAAMHAFETCLRLGPTRIAPYYWLERLAAERLHDHEAADVYRKRRRASFHSRKLTATPCDNVL
jgi:tetratricopeptide (TPR) repeat protein